MSYNRYIDEHHDEMVRETEKWSGRVPASAEERYEQGFYFFRALDYVRAAGLFREAAGEGETEALYMLAYCLENGFGADPDHEQAGALFRRYTEALQGRVDRGLPLEPLRRYRLGVCLRYGYGVPADELRALELFESCGGLGEASLEIGRAYRDGRCGLLPDGEKATGYFMKAYGELCGEALFEAFALFGGRPQDYPYLLELRTGYAYLLGRHMRVVKCSPNADSLARLSRVYEMGYPGDTPQGLERSTKRAKKYRTQAKNMK